MPAISRWLAVLPMAWLVATAASTCHGQSDAPLPNGVRAVWDLAKAYRETTPTRERVCINGLWRWQPAAGKIDQVPADNWGFLKVPGPWPQYRTQPWLSAESQVVHPHPSWKDKDLKEVDLAWYQREIAVPAGWAGRRIALQTDFVFSYAAVYVDDQRAGVVVYPGGELDITPACRPGQKHRLSIFVATIPFPDPKDVNAYALRQDLEGYLKQPLDKRTKGFGPFRGLVGDAYLVSAPAGPRIEDVKAGPSVRKWELEIDAAVSALKDGERYSLLGRVLDGQRKVTELTSDPFTAAEAKDGRVRFARPWKPEKLWDTDTPGNQYDLAVSLLDSAGKAVDEFQPVRFGFREFWIDGKDLRLNGTRVHWSATPMDNAQMSPAMANYAKARETFRRLKRAGINMMYTHNYGCAPGTHLAFQELLRAADDEGMMISFTLPHAYSYDWPWNAKEPAEKTNGFPQDLEYYVRQAQNHPSVVVYSTNHNFFGYANDQNPDLIDGKGERTGRWADLGRLSEDLIHRFDSTRPIYHHASGNFGQMYTINCYLDFVPIQERSDWFGHWATEGVKPLFPNEYGVPYVENWGNHREGHSYFGWRFLMEFLYPEWGSQWRGDIAYQLEEDDVANIRWEAQKWRKQEQYHKSEYPTDAYRTNSPNIRGVEAMYVAENWPAFRTWGLSGLNFWAINVNWMLRKDAAKAVPRPATDWENLQRPGYSPDYAVTEKYHGMEIAYDESDWAPTLVGKEFVRCNQPVLAWIAGRPSRFTSQDHNFLPGEVVEKQIIVINDSRRTIAADVEWVVSHLYFAHGGYVPNKDVTPPAPAGGKSQVTVEAGEQARIPLRFELPATARPGRYELTMAAKLSTGEAQKDSFALHVLPAVMPQPAAKIALFDPIGQTEKRLSGLQVAFDKVAAEADLSAYDVLIVGKNALTPFGPGPDVSRVRQGLKVVVFEQTKETLERRFGFRVQEYVLRRVFPRVPDHPVLAGLSAENLRDWRGEGTTVSPRLEGVLRHLDSAPHGLWAGFWNTRPWRCGCYGSVASLLMEKPACGDFLPIVDGGFSLQYAPLMEYREGQGMVLFCQLDVTGRTEDDPAAARLVRNILGYAASWKPAPRRTALYAGEPACKAHIERTGLSLADYKGGPLTPDQVLVVGPGGGNALAPHAAAIAEWLKAGGHLLAVGLDQDEANAFLPAKITLKRAEHIAAWFAPPGRESPFAGVGPADLYIRDPREIPLAADGTDPLGDGVLAKAKDSNVVLFALRPWEFDYLKPNGGAWTFGHKCHNVKWTFQRSSFALTRVLANLGVAAPAPVLQRIKDPALDEEWLQDLLEAPWLESGEQEFVLSTRWKGLAMPKHHDFKGLPEGWETPAFDDSQWRPIRVPGLWAERYEDLAGMQGTMLHRLKFRLPQEWANREGVSLVLGKVVDSEVTYLNGTLIGSITYKNTPGAPAFKVRKYAVPRELLKPGENVLAFAADNWGAGGVSPAGDPRQAKRLEHPARYLAPEGTRYLHGLYLDMPEAMDDPYRYLRW